VTKRNWTWKQAREASQNRTHFSWH
jgi:hypothetical protein